ncbi:UbiX family flavin prenyltransferase [Desulfofundulus thermosubterraneus]|uniref:Flavin prenyltransferase UbiX n=1 Tax=Desulfofundulus thermosubterraneus DSM 16057 TaxID=1121432 RepID=A0A1M6A7S6_9FIRM|nr:UbiX family flavin prenyltransferase [Desulfofundulus thermosubterraneus]SHI32515.1 4-hydroxy-3-polyprenylbenzoate decarboxylase [Desulfofundulus thermosubterraneus DSM 16057]
MRIILGITGASGAVYGITLLEQLKLSGIETHLILSPWAAKTIALETRWTPEQVMALASYSYTANDLAAPVASGSFMHQGMVIAPCSMKTLASIAWGYSDNLITRAADVTIKERRPLILMIRETPLSAIHLENMLKLARLGVIIMPPVPSFYQHPETIEDLVLQTTGRVLDLLGIENSLVKRWGGTR